MALYDSESRYRRRFLGRMIRLVIYLGILVLVGLFSFQLGIEDFEARKESFNTQVRSMQDEMDRLASENASMSVEMRQIQDYALDLEGRYKRDAPTAEERRFLDLIKSRIDDGLSMARMELFINAAGEPRECSDPVGKRFLVRTPIYKGANTAASFENDTITVLGDGASVLTESGAPQAWFDPAKPVTITVTEIGGAEHTTTGLLPLTTSVLRDGSEFLFSMQQGARGFVQVTVRKCKAL